MTEAFCQHDPVESALKITPDEFRVLVELELQAVLGNDLSLAGRDAHSGRMVGALVAMDALTGSADCRGRISQKFEPISEIARNLHDFYIENRKIVPGSCLYVFMIGVRSDIAGHGIGKMLIREGLKNARTKGYRSAFVMTTNLASANVFESHRFRTLKTVSYQTFRYKDRLEFASITQHPGIALMERECLVDSSQDAALPARSS